MPYTIEQIAERIGAEAVGAADLTIVRAAEPAGAAPDELALAMAPKYAGELGKGRARAAVLWSGADWRALGLEAAILVGRPRFAMSSVTQMLDPGPGIAPGIHPTAVIDPSARIGDNAAIGPLAVIGPGARIGANARILPQVTIYRDVTIGDDALIHAGVRIAARVRIGDRFIAQPGAVIGGDGFSFVTPEKSGVERARETMGDQGEIVDQHWARIHSLGSVTIGDDVEIGSNANIDRGTIRDTIIGSGTRIDSMVHVGHNTRIGRDCLLCGMTGIAGSVSIGDRVILGGATGVADNLVIGNDVITGGGTKVVANVPAGRVMWGYPATKMETAVESYKALRRLPRLFREVAALRKALSKPGSND
ncbi:UDP-3-O-(3-hydroxymyristoyl)glucosamine N-acyltransferase [Tropicimonas sp.]|uniref:UDP-3-O-(3-hydroxymyristoyl)glucosamine N-acyltransferase n=1 Tax=Tropicimonas sp. TaxID=2067044 RepID=UPI003A86A860